MSQGAHVRHLDLAKEVLSGGWCQRGRYTARKAKVTQPADASLVSSSTNTNDPGWVLPGLDLAIASHRTACMCEQNGMMFPVLRAEVLK